MSNRKVNLRTFTASPTHSKSGQDAMKKTASDSLSGDNKTTEYRASGGVPKDNLGGRHSGK